MRQYSLHLPYYANMNAARNIELRGKFPKTLLILGTDLAGKDHFANVVSDAAYLAGLKVEKRRGLFSACPDQTRTSEQKGVVNLLAERLFLSTLPLSCRFLPQITAFLTYCDLHRFNRPNEGAVLVVSHTPIRLLAFALGHLHQRIEQIQMPSLVVAALGTLVEHTDAKVIVLDIDHKIRQARLEQRLRRGTADHFDRYMSRNPDHSERIENFLVWIGTTYLGARRIENNDASDAQLLAALND